MKQAKCHSIRLYLCFLFLMGIIIMQVYGVQCDILIHMHNNVMTPVKFSHQGKFLGGCCFSVGSFIYLFMYVFIYLFILRFIYFLES